MRSALKSRAVWDSAFMLDFLCALGIFSGKPRPAVFAGLLVCYQDKCVWDSVYSSMMEITVISRFLK